MSPYRDCSDLCPLCGREFTISEGVQVEGGPLCCSSPCAISAYNEANAARADMAYDRERDERLLRGEGA
jgi:hypothetical protein